MQFKTKIHEKRT